MDSWFKFSASVPLPSDRYVNPSREKPVVRVWIDVTGNYKVQATYVDFEDGKVTLRRSDGKEVEVDIEKLSANDRQVVRERAGSE